MFNKRKAEDSQESCHFCLPVMPVDELLENDR